MGGQTHPKVEYNFVAKPALLPISRRRLAQPEQMVGNMLASFLDRMS